MKKLKLMIVLFSLLFLVSCATKVRSIRQDINGELAVGEGYLLLAVDTNYALEKIVIVGKKDIVLTRRDLWYGTNFILINLPAGHYAIESIKVNYFFEFDTDELRQSQWDFEVKENVISYVGHLQVNTQRNDYFISTKIELLNKSSFALEYLERNFSKILSNQRVQYWGPGDDTFFAEVGSDE